jgi:hypothetical protein
LYVLLYMKGSIHIDYNIVDTYLTMEVSAKIPEADYLAVGFTEKQDMMIGADSILYDAGEVKAYKLKSYVVSDFVPLDTKAYLKETSFSYLGGVRTFKFSRLLDTGNGDIPITVEKGSCNMIFATGTSFSNHLANRWSIDIPLKAGVPINGAPGGGNLFPTGSWIYYIMMFLPLVALALLAIISATFSTPLTLGFTMRLFHQYFYRFDPKIVCFGYHPVLRLSAGTSIFWLIWFTSAAAYFYIMLTYKLASLTLSSGLFSYMNFAVTLCPVSKTSFWVKVFNLPFERAVAYHILLACINIIAVAVHTYLVVVKYDTGILSSTSFGTIIPLAGAVAFGSMLTMAFIALFVRRFWWELFYYTHKICAFVALVGVILHYTAIAYLLGVPVFLYVIDLFYQVKESYGPGVKVRKVEAREDLTLIEIDTPAAFRSFEAGSYAFIHIPSIDRVSHPFSISSAPGKSTMTFHIKSMGSNSSSNSNLTWTGKLRTFANRNSLFFVNPAVALELGGMNISRKTVPDDNHDTGGSPVTAYKVEKDNASVDIFPSSGGILEMHVLGPFGCLSVKLDTADHVIMIAGGIGVTPFMSIFEDL